MGNRPSRHDYSAGGVAYRILEQDQANQVQVALIATRRHSRWQLPKGTVEAGESPEQTAVREVAEEAGLETHCQIFLKTIEFGYTDSYRKNPAIAVHKRVDFYLLKVVGGKLSDSSFEVDGVGWFTPEDALNALTFQNERDVLQLAMEHWQ